jgi:hypothetical protein
METYVIKFNNLLIVLFRFFSGTPKDKLSLFYNDICTLRVDMLITFLSLFLIWPFFPILWILVYLDKADLDRRLNYIIWTGIIYAVFTGIGVLAISSFLNAEAALDSPAQYTIDLYLQYPYLTISLFMPYFILLSVIAAMLVAGVLVYIVYIISKFIIKLKATKVTTKSKKRRLITELYYSFIKKYCNPITFE